MKTKFLSPTQIQVLEILFEGGTLRDIHNEPLFMESVEGDVTKIIKPTFNLLIYYGLIEKGLRLSNMCQEYKLSGKGFKLINEF